LVESESASSMTLFRISVLLIIRSQSFGKGEVVSQKNYHLPWHPLAHLSDNNARDPMHNDTLPFNRISKPQPPSHFIVIVR
jgi:hypothetical protein